MSRSNFEAIFGYLDCLLKKLCYNPATMPVERSLEDRHGNVIKSEIVDPGDKQYQLSPRGFWRTLKNTVFGQTQENPPTTGQSADGVYRGSYADRGSITVTREKRTLSVLPDDKIRIEYTEKYKKRQLNSFGLEPLRRGSHSLDRVVEKPEGVETAEIARTDRFGFPPKVEVFRWVSSDKAPQSR